MKKDRKNYCYVGMNLIISVHIMYIDHKFYKLNN